MKVYFGESLEDMVREIRARGTETIRVHALSYEEGEQVRIDVHATTLCGGQIYEAVSRSFHSVDAEDEARRNRVRELGEEEREKVVDKFAGFEVRRGILQE